MATSERSRRFINDSFETACQGRRPRDYTRLGNEVKTSARRPAMRRNLRIREVAVGILAASGLIGFLPSFLHAQEQVAQRPDLAKADSPKPGSLEQGVPAGIEPSDSRTQT